MAKYFCFVLLLLLVHLDNAFVVGQITFGDYNSDEQNIVTGLYRFVKEQHILNSDAWITLTKSIQSEFQNLKAQISSLEDRNERHDIYLKNSNEDIKSKVQTATNELKTQISRQEDRNERHDTYLKN